MSVPSSENQKGINKETKQQDFKKSYGYRFTRMLVFVCLCLTLASLEGLLLKVSFALRWVPGHRRQKLHTVHNRSTLCPSNQQCARQTTKVQNVVLLRLSFSLWKGSAGFCFPPTPSRESNNYALLAVSSRTACFAMCLHMMCTHASPPKNPQRTSQQTVKKANNMTSNKQCMK
eukprot:3832758-Amphidinium_carterae.1